MITLLGAMLAEHIVDTAMGQAIVPKRGMELNVQDRGKSDLIPFKCIAVIQLYGGKQGDEPMLGISIAPPDAPEINLQDKPQRWKDSSMLSITALISQPVPLQGGGLYVVKFSLDQQPLVELQVPIVWSKF